MPPTFEQSKDDIARLVKHFATNQAVYRAPAYKEAHARQEFIDPFFVALGWDVSNAQHAAPDYREVVVEDSVEIQGQKKAPDYVFRVGRERKFFVEAKKPGVDLKKDPLPAYQLRRYGWTAKLPLSLLTDFEELAVYDCRIRPSEKDKATTARINYFAFKEYPDRWREVWDIFSREAILGGAFDQYAQAGKGKRGTSEVDAEFLKEIESWREALARSLALRNPRLTIDELNDAVQRTIDRIIFLRMTEDRGMEDYGRLLRLSEGDNIYKGLVALFRHADAKYNSGLFDFSREGDQLTPGLTLEDKALRPILANLYFPQSPYEFSVLPVEILGNVYEQFLGKVIRLTPSHQAKVEEKPEVKKAGGVYYTPAYIVEYIVKNTVGKLAEGKSPLQLRGFRVLDPACGSGSFLLGAYQYLLDYYQSWYTANAPEKHPKAVWQQGEAWRLTTKEKKRILTEHIFGVDIDRQAVEVTKLSLLLKVLETDSDESMVKQVAMFQEEAKERALPNLDRNIKCGNSLIGPDYFSGQLLPDDAELRRVNPFDWKKEFPEAMKRTARPLWFVTFVTHNSRISERMVTYGVQTGEPLIFSPDDQVLIAEKIFETCRQEGLAVVAANVLPDHVHLVIAAEDEPTLEEHIRKLKGASSYAFQRARGWEKGSGQHVWAQKFNRVPITDSAALTNILQYVTDNHLKHVERWGETLLITWDKGLKPLVQAGCVSVEEACQPRGGFDCVIGNPPYIRMEEFKNIKSYLRTNYQTHADRADIYYYFVEKATNVLKENGRLGFILSNTFVRSRAGRSLRSFVTKALSLEALVEFGDFTPFEGATVYPIILIAEKMGDKSKQIAFILQDKNPAFVGPDKQFVTLVQLPPEYFGEDAWIFDDPELTSLRSKLLSKFSPLRESHGEVCMGIKSGLNQAFLLSDAERKKILATNPKAKDVIKPYVGGKNLDHYYYRWDEEWIIYTPHSIDMTPYPGVIEHLRSFKPELQKRATQQEWYELQQPQEAYASLFNKPKIIFPDISRYPKFSLDTQGMYFSNTVYFIASDSQYLLGLLNSKLLWFVIRGLSNALRGGMWRFRLFSGHIERLPIRPINFSDPNDKARHDQMVKLVEQMLDLSKRLAAAQDGSERGRLQRLIDSTDQQIDALVYELYELTPEEIAIVEGRAA